MPYFLPYLAISYVSSYKIRSYLNISYYISSHLITSYILSYLFIHCHLSLHLIINYLFLSTQSNDLPELLPEEDEEEMNSRLISDLFKIWQKYDTEQNNDKNMNKIILMKNMRRRLTAGWFQIFSKYDKKWHWTK